jgi:predicted MFS family arabinose efflux permease
MRWKKAEKILAAQFLKTDPGRLPLGRLYCPVSIQSSTLPISADASIPGRERESVLRVLCAAAFLIFFKSYLVAPLIPSLSSEFHASIQLVGLLISAYLLPYGFSTLFYGPISDRVGRRPILLALLAAMALTCLGTASAHSIWQLLIWRMIAGVTTGGIIPISLALFGDLYPYNQRGRPIGWLFGAIAGGMAFGSTFGAILNPILGWRVLFLLIGIAGAIDFAFAWRHRRLLDGTRNQHPPGLAVIIQNYWELLRDPRGARTYGMILLNGMFHSGIFAWLGLYFSRRYGLGDRGIGLALLGYGVPGLFLGPLIGHLADRFGRRIVIPVGLLLAAACAFALIPSLPLAFAAATITFLSLGFDLSHPPLTGIVTSLNPHRRGQALGLNAFVLFMGFGFGSLVFQLFLRSGFDVAFGVFAIAQCIAGILAIRLFHAETAVAATMHG